MSSTSPGWTHTGYAQQIVFGSRTIERLPELTRALGVRRVLLVTTAGRLASADGQRVVTALGRSLASTFAEVTSHVPTNLVQSALLNARRDGIDGIVSFGGGSCADLAKAVAFFTEQEAGTPGASFFDRPAVPHISIPTTYSGAELTAHFGMTDPRTRQKSGAGGPTSAPSVAVYDVEATAELPARASAETGMNALAHCIEAAWSPVRTPEAEAIAQAGVSRIVEALPRVVDAPEDLDARTRMLEGAVLGGRCLQNAAMGVHHGLSQLVGGRTGIPHGLANAVILKGAMRFNADEVPESLALALGGGDPADAVERLTERLGLPSTLSEVGVTDEDIQAVARLSQSNPNVRANPRPCGEGDALAILEGVF